MSQFAEYQPLWSAELNTPDVIAMGREYNAALYVGYGSAVYEAGQLWPEDYNTIGVGAAGLGTLAEREPNMDNAAEYYEGDFSLSYLPEIDRADPYTLGFRR